MNHRAALKRLSELNEGEAAQLRFMSSGGDTFHFRVETRGVGLRFIMSHQDVQLRYVTVAAVFDTSRHDLSWFRTFLDVYRPQGRGLFVSIVPDRVRRFSQNQKPVAV